MASHQLRLNSDAFEAKRTAKLRKKHYKQLENDGLVVSRELHDTSLEKLSERHDEELAKMSQTFTRIFGILATLSIVAIVVDGLALRRSH
jgi:CTP-dependent riboflavin kinase